MAKTPVIVCLVVFCIGRFSLGDINLPSPEELVDGIESIARHGLAKEAGLFEFWRRRSVDPEVEMSTVSSI